MPGENLSWNVNDLSSYEGFAILKGNADVGTTTGIVITVKDIALASDSLAPFDLTVANVNDAPTLSGTPVTSATEDTPYSFTATGSDVDAGGTLTLSTFIRLITQTRAMVGQCVEGDFP